MYDIAHLIGQSQPACAVPLRKEGSMDRFTEQFIHDQNIHRYRMLLWRVTDEVERLVLLDLLDAEEAKQLNKLPPRDK
jgi:hypothetical protein